MGLALLLKMSSTRKEAASEVNKIKLCLIALELLQKHLGDHQVRNIGEQDNLVESGGPFKSRKVTSTHLQK